MQYTLLVLSGLIPAILADRGSASQISPTECNAEPTSTETATAAATPTCHHAADPNGGMGLCPDLSSSGWCDCGGDGNYPNLEGSDVCGYTSLPSTTLALTTTDCASSASTSVLTLTVSPVPVSSAPVSTAPAQRRAEPTYTAIPDRRRESRKKIKRDGTLAFSDCGDSPGDTWTNAGFNSKEDVLRQAYTDARTLASKAQSVSSDNKGFTHYFGGTGADVQLDHFQKMMGAIASDDKYYSITFECKDRPSCTDQSVLVTNAEAGGANDAKTIEVCDAFWTAASTKYLLYNGQKTEPSPPYRSQDQWCRKSTANGDSNVSQRTNQFFATAGHSILHELTHLDALAEQAGLAADDDKDSPDYGRHGTLDVQGQCELSGARQFLKDYDAGKTSNTSPDYNAESYAAAATEIWFMDICGFSQIRPVI